MKITLNFSQFLDNWPDSRKDQFSYEGKKALFDYLEEYEESTGEEIEFDPIALCCEYSEFDDIEDYLSQYPSDRKLEEFDTYDNPEDNKKEYHEAIMEDLRDKTQVIEIEGSESFIIQQY